MKRMKAPANTQKANAPAQTGVDCPGACTAYPELKPLYPLAEALWRHNAHDAIGTRALPDTARIVGVSSTFTCDDVLMAFSRKNKYLYKACTKSEPLSINNLEKNVTDLLNPDTWNSPKKRTAAYAHPTTGAASPLKPLQRSVYILQNLSVWHDNDVRRHVVNDVCNHLCTDHPKRIEDVSHLKEFELEPLLLLWETYPNDARIPHLQHRLLLYLCGMLIFPDQLLELEEAELCFTLDAASEKAEEVPLANAPRDFQKLREDLFDAASKALGKDDTASYTAFRSIFYGFNIYVLGAQADSASSDGTSAFHKPNDLLENQPNRRNEIAQRRNIPGVDANDWSFGDYLSDRLFPAGKNLPRNQNERAIDQMNWGACYLPDGELAPVKRAKWALARASIVQRDLTAIVQRDLRNRFKASNLLTEEVIRGIKKCFNNLLTNPLSWDDGTFDSKDLLANVPHTSNRLITILYAIQEGRRHDPPAKRAWDIMSVLLPKLCAAQLAKNPLWGNPESLYGDEGLLPTVRNAFTEQWGPDCPSLPCTTQPNWSTPENIVKQTVFAALFSPQLLHELIVGNEAAVTQLDADTTRPYTLGLSIAICPECPQDVVCHPETERSKRKNVLTVTPQEAQMLVKQVANQLHAHKDPTVDPWVVVAVLGRASIGRLGDTNASNEHYCTSEKFLRKIPGASTLTYGFELNSVLGDINKPCDLRDRPNRRINGYDTKLTDAEVDSIFQHRLQLACTKSRVSRLHAAILYHAGQFYYADLQSTNGSCVKRESLSFPLKSGSEPLALETGDAIRMGTCEELAAEDCNRQTKTAPIRITLRALPQKAGACL